MLPSDAVRHMRGQHARIRGLMGEVEQLLKDPSALTLPPLLARLAALAAAVREHNRDEEDYIPPFLADLGRRGAKHTEKLLAEHVSEHEALVAGIEAAAKSGIQGGKDVWAVLRCIGELRSHMDREEREFLNDDVIQDVPVTDGASS